MELLYVELISTHFTFQLKIIVTGNLKLLFVSYGDCNILISLFINVIINSMLQNNSLNRSKKTLGRKFVKLLS